MNPDGTVVNPEGIVVPQSEIDERMARIAHFIRAPKEAYFAKSAEKANLYREEGNKFYKAKNFYEAKYNMGRPNIVCCSQ